MHDPSTEAWIDELPDALDEPDRFVAALDGRRPALFLDYDGTLAPIAATPEAAVLSEATRHTIERLAGCCTVAVVSGRDRLNVDAMIGVPGLVVAGSHGFDLAGPDWSHQHPEGLDAAADLARAADELDDAVRGIPGIIVERKAFAVAVHVRQVAPDERERIEAAVAEVGSRHPALRRSEGKLIHELRPAAPWDKGRAVRYLMERLGVDPVAEVPVYLGDDLTDEDALDALRADGIGIVVGTERRRTAAKFRLEDPTAVAVFLDRLADRLGAPLDR